MHRKHFYRRLTAHISWFLELGIKVCRIENQILSHSCGLHVEAPIFHWDKAKNSIDVVSKTPSSSPKRPITPNYSTAQFLKMIFCLYLLLLRFKSTIAFRNKPCLIHVVHRLELQSPLHRAKSNIGMGQRCITHHNPGESLETACLWRCHWCICNTDLIWPQQSQQAVLWQKNVKNKKK